MNLAVHQQPLKRALKSELWNCSESNTMTRLKSLNLPAHQAIEDPEEKPESLLGV